MFFVKGSQRRYVPLRLVPIPSYMDGEEWDVARRVINQANAGHKANVLRIMKERGWTPEPVN